MLEEKDEKNAVDNQELTDEVEKDVDVEDVDEVTAKLLG